MRGKIKKEYEILLPKLFREKTIGKTISDKADKVVGRKFLIYARDIDPTTRKYYYKLAFKIFKVEEEKAFTHFVGSEVSRSFISKNVRRHSTRIDVYVKNKTKDDKDMVLKVFIVTPRNVKSSIARNIRKKTEEHLKSYISDNTMETIVKEILRDNLQRNLKKILKVIYPIDVAEIRKIEIKYAS